MCFASVCERNSILYSWNRVDLRVIGDWRVREVSRGKRRCVLFIVARSRTQKRIRSWSVVRVRTGITWNVYGFTCAFVKHLFPDAYVNFQAVGCSLNLLGFGESLAGLLQMNSSKWAEKLFASGAVFFLWVINLVGVKWVVKLQFLLLLVLLLTGLDFAVGSFVHTDIRESALLPAEWS